MNTSDQAKIAAGRYAADNVVGDGQIVGLGSGTSAWFFIRALAGRVESGLSITGVPASTKSRALAEELRIPLVDIDDVDHIDVCVDGADEIDEHGNMIKGGGANLLWEKIINHASHRVYTVVDPSKLVTALGAFPLPIEVNPFGHMTTVRSLSALFAELGYGDVPVRIRMDGQDPLVTDNGNFIADAELGQVRDAAVLEQKLPLIPGVVEHGLFLGRAHGVIVGQVDGTAELREFKLR